MSKRAAVVIGVDDVEGLSIKLAGAAAGAREVALFLSDEKNGFDVKTVVDSHGPVTVDRVKEAIASFVQEPVKYHFLLIYFSGHGMEINWEDHCLLSGAPRDPDAAINLAAAALLAQRCGIENVTFIADCCRTKPEGAIWSPVRGSSVFPNFNLAMGKVDIFKATSPAKSAYEIPTGVENEAKSVLTEALLSAFNEPQPGMVFPVDGKQVVPNRKLEPYLEAKVPELLRDVDKNLIQTVECTVPSGDDVYIATASRLPSVGEPVSLSGLIYQQPTVQSVGKGWRGSALSELELIAARPRQTISSASELAPALKAAYLEAAASGGEAHSPYLFLVRGDLLAGVCNEQGQSLQFAKAEDEVGPYNWVSLAGEETGSSAALIFESGRCVVLPILPNYIGHLFLDEAGLQSVYYAANSNHPKSEYYQDLLKPAAKPARDFTSKVVFQQDFWPGSSSDIEQLDFIVENLSAFDPSFALYLAYGYSIACEDASSTQLRMRFAKEVSGLFFDFDLLDNKDAEGEGLRMMPRLPLLTRGWNYLTAREVVLHPVFEANRHLLCRSLWTCFQEPAGETVFKTAERGNLI